ncbi:MAG: NUDIX hydrolase [Candidatus Aureabacteria bacterium]|nr:NUDIX hydrolase [Candidatus Auribacterota bacterium]
MKSGRKKSDAIEILSEGRVTRYVRRDGWEYIDRTNCSHAVFLLAVTDDKRILLVEQFRPPLGKNVIELPAGLVADREGDAEESIERAALRELEEETGYRAKKITKVLEGPISAGLSSEIGTLVRAEGIAKVSSGGGSDDESIFVHEVPVSSVENWLEKSRRRGILVDPKIYTALYFIQEKKLNQKSKTRVL